MGQESSKISFHYLTTAFSFPHRRQLKAFLLQQLKKEGKTVAAINYIFCNDAYLLEINLQYLNHATYTDIITFELSEPGQPLVADIYISVERVKENARIFHSSFRQELHRVIFHGILHLTGYKDKTKADAAVMRAKEEAYLSLYFVSRSTVS